MEMKKTTVSSMVHAGDDLRLKQVKHEDGGTYGETYFVLKGGDGDFSLFLERSHVDRLTALMLPFAHPETYLRQAVEDKIAELPAWQQAIICKYVPQICERAAEFFEESIAEAIKRFRPDE